MHNGSSVGICAHYIHVFFSRLGTDLYAQSVLSTTKFLHRSSVRSLSRVRCWLGTPSSCSHGRANLFFFLVGGKQIAKGQRRKKNLGSARCIFFSFSREMQFFFPLQSFFLVFGQKAFASQNAFLMLLVFSSLFKKKKIRKLQTFFS